MATTNHTPNYNLPQWLASDKVGIMANLNPAFSTIDEKLHEAVVNAENAATTSSAANQVANDAANQVNIATGNITEIQADILTIQNLLNTAVKDINDLTTFESVTLTMNPNVQYNYSLTCTKTLKNFLMILSGFIRIQKLNYTNGTVLCTTNFTPKNNITLYGIPITRKRTADSQYETILHQFVLNTNGTITFADNSDCTNDAEYPSIGLDYYINISNS